MNLFFLHADPTAAARMHCNSHVVSQLRETAQMLSTAHHLHDCALPAHYKPTHPNHPSTKWVRASRANYEWTFALFASLHDEYQYRYGSKSHLSWARCSPVVARPPSTIRGSSLTPPPMVIADDLRERFSADADWLAVDMSTAVAAYREAYNRDKRHLFTWSRRPPPKWVRGYVTPVTTKQSVRYVVL